MAYFNDEKRNLTNPEIFFVFGIMNKDTGRVFNPDDDGHLVYDYKFDFLSEESQIWLNHFISTSIASRLRSRRRSGSRRWATSRARRASRCCAARDT